MVSAMTKNILDFELFRVKKCSITRRYVMIFGSGVQAKSGEVESVGYCIVK